MVSSVSAARLVADVGGTNARMGWQAAPGADITDVKVYPCADYPALQAVIEAYLRDLQRPAPAECSIGIACPVIGDQVRMTNHHWQFSIVQMRDALGLKRLVVINDFTAQALAMPGLPEAERRQVGPGVAVSGAPVAVIGPGTGLGVSGLLPGPQGHWVPLMGEGGHVSLSAHTPEEVAVVEWLQTRFGHASAERAISGQGLENLYEAVCALQGGAGERLTAAEVSTRALSGQDERCVRALSLMCSLLGSVAGNLTLTLGASGGVYLVGGILPRLGTWLDRSDFRRRFEAKGRYAGFLAQVPTWVVTSTTSPALAGAARALDEL
jgi:glucokinase